MSAPVPTLEVEQALARRCGPGARIVVGVDEVGRGALAGPVAVGACAILVTDGSASPLPDGVRDSKKLTAKRREALVGPIHATALSGAVGWASAAEIDEVGIMTALTTAALRALTGLDLAARGSGIDAILLDGDVDVLTPALAEARRRDGVGSRPVPLVQLQVSADRDCASVAAASILAKVARDAHMVEIDADAPAYGWASNKGYGSAAHREAIDQLGAHEHHRRSWRLGSRLAPARPAIMVPGPAVVPVPVAPAAPGPAPVPAPVDPARSAVVPTPPIPGVLWGDDWPAQQGKGRA